MFCKPWKDKIVSYLIGVQKKKKNRRHFLHVFKPFVHSGAGVSLHLKGHVGDVDQLVVCQGEQVEEAKLGEGSGLDLFHSVTVDHELLQRG